jgi:hypothetical protein
LAGLSRAAGVLRYVCGLEPCCKIEFEAEISFVELSMRSLAAVGALELPSNLFNMTPNSNFEVVRASCISTSPRLDSPIVLYETATAHE